MLAQELPLSCGAACARELLRQKGISYPEEYIRQAASYSEGVEGVGGGIFAPLLGQALSTLSNESWVGETLGNIDAVEQIPLRLKARVPLIAMLGKHWVIVSEYTNGAFEILDPEPYAPGGPFATEGMLDVTHFVDLFKRGRFQVVERT